MDELRAMTKAGDYHLIRQQKIGCLIRLEGFDVFETPLDCTVRVGRSGSYPAFLYNTDALRGIEDGDVVDVEGVIVDESYSFLHVWVRHIRVKSREPE